MIEGPYLKHQTDPFALALILILAFIGALSMHRFKIPDYKPIQVRHQENLSTEDINKLCSLDVVTCGTEGLASWYSYKLPGGYDSKDHYVCASRDYKRGTTLTVTDVANGKISHCLVTDYGPQSVDRIIDLSPRVFSELEDLKLGLIGVTVSTQ